MDNERMKANRDRLEKEIRDVIENKMDRQNAIMIMEHTPRLLRQLGLDDLPILFTQRHLRNCLHEKDPEGKKHWHGLNIGTIVSLPEYLQEPVLVMDSIDHEDSIVVVTPEVDGKAGDETRLPIIASIMLNGNGQYQFEKMDSNFLTSVYGHKALDSILVHAITMDKILYVDKEKALELGNLAKLTLLGRLPQLGLNGIIHQSQNIVNEDEEKTSMEQVEGHKETLLSFMDSLYGVGFTVLNHNRPLSLDRGLDKKNEDQRTVVITDDKTIDVLAEKDKNAVYINRISTLNNGTDTTDVDMIRSAIRMRPDVIHFEDGSGWTEIKNTKFDIESDVKNVYSGYRLLDYGPVSHYKEDRYLNAVLALAQDGSYTTWIHNSYTGLRAGHYGIKDIDKAYLEYYGRMREDVRPEYRVCRYSGKYLPEAYKRLHMEDMLEDLQGSGEVVGYFESEEEAKNYLEAFKTEVEKGGFGRLNVKMYAVEEHQYSSDGELLTCDVIAFTEKAPFEEPAKENFISFTEPISSSDREITDRAKKDRCQDYEI